MKKLFLCCMTIALVFFKSSAFADTAALSDPKAIAVKTAQATLAFKTKDYVKAVSLFRELTETNPKDALSWQYIGQSLAQTNDLLGAARAYAKVLEIKPEGPLADSTRDMMAHLPAPDLFAMKIDPGLTLGDWMPMAEDQVKQGKRTEVLEKIKQYLDRFGPVPQLLSFQTRLLQETMDTLKVEDAETSKSSLPQIRELVAQAPTNPDVLQLEAHACHYIQDFECAVAAYSAWLNYAAGNSPDRKDMVSALLQARNRQVPDKFFHIPLIGVNILNLTPELEVSSGLSNTDGVLILNIEDNSPADKAGIQVNDVILKVDGKKINSSSDFSRVLAKISHGSKVSVQLWRSHQSREISLTVGEMSAAELAAKVDQAMQVFKDGDFERALALFRELTLLSPQDALVWQYLGQTLDKTHDEMGARSAYIHVLKIQPEGPIADSTREMLAKLPAPDLFAMQLDSGITLGDWMKLADQQLAEGKRENVLQDIAQYLNQFGPVPQLLTLQEKLQQEIKTEQQQRLQNAIDAVRFNSAATAKTALLQIRQLKTQAPGNLTLIRLEARACYLLHDYSCAKSAYAAWLKTAPGSDPLREGMVEALMQTSRQESLPLPPPVQAANAATATGEIIHDCDHCPEMVVISKGSFEMSDAMAKHTVTFAQPFAIARTEVTQAQWKELMGNNPSHFKDCGDTCPVEQVSWNDANEYIKRLNAKTGKQYRLPSEAEWEAACRAGEEQAYCGSDSADNVAWYGAYAAGNSIKTTHPVAAKQPNAWGLYDMSGNTWEWVEDSWHDNFNGAPTNGSAWTGDGAKRVVRGGSWVSPQQSVSAVSRDWDGVVDRYYFNGFRLARTLP